MLYVPGTSTECDFNDRKTCGWAVCSALSPTLSEKHFLLFSKWLAASRPRPPVRWWVAITIKPHGLKSRLENHLSSSNPRNLQSCSSGRIDSAWSKKKKEKKGRKHRRLSDLVKLTCASRWMETQQKTLFGLYFSYVPVGKTFAIISNSVCVNDSIDFFFWFCSWRKHIRFLASHMFAALDWFSMGDNELRSPCPFRKKRFEVNYWNIMLWLFESDPNQSQKKPPNKQHTQFNYSKKQWVQ